MPDVCDLAAEREEEFRRSALRAHHRCGDVEPGPETCRVCGDDIPEARRKTVPGTNICGDCARDLTQARRGGS